MAYLAILLRAVNIGPSLRVTAADLRGAATDVGLGSARTLLNSGNLVATSGTSGVVGPDDAARLVQERLTERLGRAVAAVGLSAERLEAIALANPFPAAARDDPAHLQVHVPFGAVDETGVARLDLANAGREMLATAAGVLYVHYADGIGRSKLSPAVIDRAVGVPTTARNWNTITKLRAACAGPTSS
jgi:uncharacterized protein (DUF1697 family)